MLWEKAEVAHTFSAPADLIATMDIAVLLDGWVINICSQKQCNV